MSLSADRGSRHAALVVPMGMHVRADAASRHHRRALGLQPSQVPRRTRCLMIAQPSSSRRRVLAQARDPSLRTCLQTHLRTGPSTNPQTSAQPCRCYCRRFHRARRYRRVLMIARRRPLPDVAVNVDARAVGRAPRLRH